MSLIARHLEAAGISTLCIGSARDILAAGQPPRAVFVDYPLGHTVGKPFDATDQGNILEGALSQLTTMTVPGTLVSLPNSWGSEMWREEASTSDGGDTRQARDSSPQFQYPADRLAARRTGALGANE